jgi:hypothetical protein
MAVYTHPSVLRRILGPNNVATMAAVAAIALAFTVGYGSSEFLGGHTSNGPATSEGSASARAVVPVTSPEPARLYVVSSAADASVLRAFVAASGVSGVSASDIVVADSPQEAQRLLDDQAAMNLLRAVAGIGPVEVVALGSIDAPLGAARPNTGAGLARQLQAVTNEQLGHGAASSDQPAPGVDLARAVQAATDEQFAR